MAVAETNVQEINAKLDKTADSCGRYLTFKLGREEYGLEILKVREIIGLMNITTVPRVPSFMKGIINLRGSVVPVIDLRLKFGLEELEYNDETCIIVLDVGQCFGIIVDTVSEVVDISADNVEKPPSLGSQVDTSCIMGMGKVDDSVKILLDIDKVLSLEEIADVQAVVEGDSE